MMPGCEQCQSRVLRCGLPTFQDLSLYCQQIFKTCTCITSNFYVLGRKREPRCVWVKTFSISVLSFVHNERVFIEYIGRLKILRCKTLHVDGPSLVCSHANNVVPIDITWARQKSASLPGEMRIVPTPVTVEAEFAFSHHRQETFARRCLCIAI